MNQSCDRKRHLEQCSNWEELKRGRFDEVFQSRESDAANLAAAQGTIPQSLSQDHVNSKHRSSTSWAELFMIYDVLSSPVPDDLMDGYHYMVKPRPDGPRVLLIFTDTDLLICDRRNRILHRHTIAESSRTSRAILNLIPPYTILDGVAIEKDFYILDLLIWNQVNFQDCDFLSRNFILKSRIEDIILTLQHVNKQEDTPSESDFRLHLLEASEASLYKVAPLYELASVSLRSKRSCENQESVSLYEPSTTCIPLDGLIFFHVNSTYSSGINTMTLHWRNRDISTWCEIATEHFATLRWRQGATFPETADSLRCEWETMHQTSWKGLATQDIYIRLTYQSVRIDDDGIIRLNGCQVIKSQPQYRRSKGKLRQQASCVTTSSNKLTWNVPIEQVDGSMRMAAPLLLSDFTSCCRAAK